MIHPVLLLLKHGGGNETDGTDAAGGDAGGGGGGPGPSGGGGGADAADGGVAAGAGAIPLSPIELYARNHALLCTIGFLILLPIGVLIARYTRTFTRRWFWAHAAIQFIISGPIILTGWAMGHHLCNELGLTHFNDPHQKTGLALLIMYLAQLAIGIFIHFVKIPTLGVGRRSLQNYFHAILGLAILALAADQVHYGLYTEWPFALGETHEVPDSAKHAYLALVVVFWALYFIGLGLLPRQFKQESASRQTMMKTEQTPATPPAPAAAA